MILGRQLDLDKLTSRERMLRTISHIEPDRVPLCFMLFEALRARCADEEEFVESQLEMGLDATVWLPGFDLHAMPGGSGGRTLPLRHQRDVEVEEHVEERQGGRALVKAYHTPVGTLTTKIDRIDDWPFGSHVPLMDDWLVQRSSKFLVEGPKDLPALNYILGPSRAGDIKRFHGQARKARRLAAKHDLVVTGGMGVGVEAAIWLCGLRNIMLSAIRRPDFVDELAKLIHEWSSQRMTIYLEEGADLYIRRGWYENAQFWPPRLYRRFVLPYLKKEAMMAHRAGAKFGYIMTSNSMPLLDMFIEAGIDVLIGLDPIQGFDTDLLRIKEELQGRVALWGGVNAYITVERGEKEDTEKATSTTIKTLAPGGGFILSPVDCVGDASERTWTNIQSMLQTWKGMREYPAAKSK